MSEPVLRRVVVGDALEILPGPPLDVRLMPGVTVTEAAAEFVAAVRHMLGLPKEPTP